MTRARNWKDRQIAAIGDFANRIGVPMEELPRPAIRNKTPLQGVYLLRGGIRFFRPLLLSPGDLLHEMGHVAVMPSRWRHMMHGDLGAADGSLMKIGERVNLEFPDSPEAEATEDHPYWQWMHADEAAAMAWSYAAALELKIDPLSVFHGRGGAYGGKAEAASIALAARGQCASLHYTGMTTKRLFPGMIRWLQL